MYFVLSSTIWAEEVPNVKTRTHTKNTMWNDAMLNMDSNKFFIVCTCTCEREREQVFMQTALFACLFTRWAVMLPWWQNTYSGQLGVTVVSLWAKYRAFKLTVDCWGFSVINSLMYLPQHTLSQCRVCSSNWFVNCYKTKVLSDYQG